MSSTRQKLLMILAMAALLALGSVGGKRVTAISQTSCVLAPPGLVAWWPGDGNADDIVDGNNGTLQNGATFAPGLVGQAFSFDGVDDFVRVSSSASLTITGDLTVEAWVNPDDVISGQRLVTKFTPGFGPADPGYRLDMGGGCFGFAVGDGVNSAAAGLCSIATAGDWFHLAGVRDTTAGKVRFFVNGVLESEVNDPTVNPQSPNDLFISSNNGFTEFFDGLIDEVSIYNRALSASEIADIFNAGSAGKCKNQPPMAMCQNVTKTADNNCGATVTPQEVDNGSFDPDGGSVTSSLDPPGPYPGPSGAGSMTTTVTLTVTDDEGLCSTCTAMVTVTNTAPTAFAGLSQIVDEGDLVTLNGTGSSDPDPGQTLTFLWTQTGGPPVTLSGADTATPTFTAPDTPDGDCRELTFELEVTDSCGAMSTDTVQIQVDDGLTLQGDRRGDCLRLFPCAGTYIWRLPDGTQLMGNVIITVTEMQVQFESPATDTNQLMGGVSLTERRGSATITIPGPNGATIIQIVDRNIDNNGPCP